MKILIVDDDPLIAECLATFAKDYFDQVETASDGISGLEKFKEFNPDITFTDVEMDKMGGKQLFMEIKRIQPNAKVFFITGNPAYSDPVFFRASALYTKPITDMKELFEHAVEVASK
jgi:YesN/AraC family two-component response regulator